MREGPVKNGDHARALEDGPAATAARRAEAVEILAGAIFTLALEGRAPGTRDVTAAIAESSHEGATTRVSTKGQISLTTKVIVGELPRARRRHLTRRSIEPPPGPTRRPARVAVMLALAHEIQHAIDGGQVPDRAEISRKLGFSRARLTQLLDLTLLAPEVQEQVLFLEAIDGVEPFSERVLRTVARARPWAEQRKAWAKLSSRVS